MCLPKLQRVQPLSTEKKRVLIIAEGFETRSLSWIKSQPNRKLFEYTVICKYSPSGKNHFEDMIQEVTMRTNNTPIVIDYNRFDPTVFEQKFAKQISALLKDEYEIAIDISAMSRMLIMIIVNILRENNNGLRIVYTEPKTWKPSEKEYLAAVEDKKKYGSRIALSSIGVPTKNFHHLQ